MTGLVLRLAGPLQAWGSHSTASERDTGAFPTRSGLIGLLACAQGVPRGESLDRYDSLLFTTRIDQPGVPTEDFHTAGGGLPRARSIPTAAGTRRPEGTAIAVTRRHYLADAVFIVAIDGPDGLIGALATALRAPRWQPFLGRRACPPPEDPFLLKLTSGDPGADLRSRVPLPPSLPGTAGSVAVGLLTEHPVPGGRLIELADLPVGPDHAYRARPVWRGVIEVPAALATGPNPAAYRSALHDYARSQS